MDRPSQNVGEVARLFLKLGFIAFGGPAAHIALMREEIVRRRQWIDDQHFLDLLGATNLIPGPNSTEMAIHIGYVRAGWRGLIAAGAAFILPAMSIVLGLAWLYVEYGNLPQVGWALYGVKPAILAVVIQALWTLGKTAIKGAQTAVIGALAVALYFFGINEIAILIGAAVAVLVARGLRNRQSLTLIPLFLDQSSNDFNRSALNERLKSLLQTLLPGGGASLIPLVAQAVEPVSLSRLFFIFLKIGSVLYGSGYVLLAFLRSDFVLRTGWLTDQQLLDAVAIGQFTPGPVFTTATFIGYLIGGWWGAILATLGIFLPAFVFVALSNPLIPRIRRSRWAGALLDGVNVASLGLMAAVTWQLGRAALVDWLTILICLVSALLLIRYKINSVWLVLGGGIIGVLYQILR